jgi:putative endonuclease
MKWSVYALKSVFRNYIYVGLSSAVERRIRQHDEGREKTTRPYRPFRLILLERFETRGEARRREVYLKSGCGKEFLKRISAETRDRNIPEE